MHEMGHMFGLPDSSSTDGTPHVRLVLRLSELRFLRESEEPKC